MSSDEHRALAKFDATVHAFRDWIETHAIGYLTRELLDGWLPVERGLGAYLLRPKIFMAQVKKLLRDLSVPGSQSHHEFFGPKSALGA